MGIEAILAADVRKEEYPATTLLQDFVLAALDQSGAVASGDSPLVTALGKALLVLELAVVKDRVALLKAAEVLVNLQNQFLELELRLKDAGIRLPRPETPLIGLDRDAFSRLGGRG